MDLQKQAERIFPPSFAPEDQVKRLREQWIESKRILGSRHILETKWTREHWMQVQRTLR